MRKIFVIVFWVCVATINAQNRAQTDIEKNWVDMITLLALSDFNILDSQVNMAVDLLGRPLPAEFQGNNRDGYSDGGYLSVFLERDRITAARWQFPFYFRDNTVLAIQDVLYPYFFDSRRWRLLSSQQGIASFVRNGILAEVSRHGPDPQGYFSVQIIIRRQRGM